MSVSYTHLIDTIAYSKHRKCSVSTVYSEGTHIERAVYANEHCTTIETFKSIIRYITYPQDNQNNSNLQKYHH